MLLHVYIIIQTIQQKELIHLLIRLTVCLLFYYILLLSKKQRGNKMKNSTIYKKLKVINNTLFFGKTIVYKFNENNIMDTYAIEKSIYDLKKYIDSAMKKYITEAYAYEVVNNNDIITLTLYCKEDNYKYNRNIDFIAIIKNKIIYL